MKIKVDRSLLPFGKNASQPEFYVAVSGGVDSIAAAIFLHGYHGSSMGICHYNHGMRRENDTMSHAVYQFARALGASFRGGVRVPWPKPPEKESLEAYLREKRFEFFNTLEKSIVLAHHLDDAVESYFMNFLRGCPERVPIPTKTVIGESTVIRPFLATRKSALAELACNSEYSWYICEDSTNQDNRYRRNWTRNVILPQLTPFGLHKIVRKKFYTNARKAGIGGSHASNSE